MGGYICRSRAGIPTMAKWENRHNLNMMYSVRIIAKYLYEQLFGLVGVYTLKSWYQQPGHFKKVVV